MPTSTPSLAPPPPLELFLGGAAWSTGDFEAALSRLIQNTATTPLWHGYIVVAVDDSKIHRSSAQVWGTYTYHNDSARCLNRAATVRAYNVVQLGCLLPSQAQARSAPSSSDQPALYWPAANRFYFRKSQRPLDPKHPGRREPFRTKCQLAVELIAAHSQAIPATGSGRHLAVFDGGYCRAQVLAPLIDGDRPTPNINGPAAISFLTRIRQDAVLYRRPQPPAAKIRSAISWGGSSSWAGQRRAS